MDRELLALIDDIYSAALEPERWPTVLERCRDLLGVLAVNLLFVDSDLHRGDVLAYAGLDPAAVAEWPSWVEQDFATMAGAKAAVGTVLCSTDLMPAAVYEGSDFYNGLMRRYGLYHLAGSKLLDAPEGFSTFGMHRPRGEPFDPAVMRLYQLLQPHLIRAIEVHSRLSRTDQRRRELAEMLDSLQVGVLLLDEHGNVVVANRVAQDLARAEDGFSMSAHGMKGATPSVTRRLQAALAGALQAGSDGLAGVALLPRPSVRRAYRVMIAPLGTRARVCAAAPRRAVAMAFVTDPERTLGLSCTALSGLFALTPAEARVTARLAEGQTTQQIAEELGVQVETVRVHLKRVYAKTGTRTQAQLLGFLLATLPPVNLHAG